MSVFWTAWQSAQRANKLLREAPQFLDLVADNARAFVAQVKQKGFDRRWLRAFLKRGKQEAEIAKELGELLKRFEQWLRSVDRNPQTQAELRQEFQEFVTSARERERGANALGNIVDQGGHVGAAVKLAPVDRALEKVLGRNLDDALKDYRAALKDLGLAGGALDAAARDAEQVLSGFLKAWETARPAKSVDEIISNFAKGHEELRQEILALRAAGKDAEAAAIRKHIVESGRDRFASTRKQVMKEVLDDPALRQRLDSVGLSVDTNGSTISFDLDLGKPQLPGQAGQTAAASVVPDLKIQLNIDHSKIDFADAIDTWINTAATDALRPVIAGSNMRIVTRFENQVLFNALKKDAEKWVAGDAKLLHGTAPQLPGSLAWETPAWNNKIDDIVRNIEALLGKSISPQERQSVRDYVELATELITKPTAG